VRTLQPGPSADARILGFAVWDLIDLRAVEAIDAIRDAYRRDDVDMSVCGDIEDVEIALGRAMWAPRRGVRTRLGASACRKKPRSARRRRKSLPRRAGFGRNDPCPCGSGKKYKKCCL
jgi:hypothetical protein